MGARAPGSTITRLLPPDSAQVQLGRRTITRLGRSRYGRIQALARVRHRTRCVTACMPRARRRRIWIAPLSHAASRTDARRAMEHTGTYSRETARAHSHIPTVIALAVRPNEVDVQRPLGRKKCLDGVVPRSCGPTRSRSGFDLENQDVPVPAPRRPTRVADTRDLERLQFGRVRGPAGSETTSRSCALHAASQLQTPHLATVPGDSAAT